MDSAVARGAGADVPAARAGDNAGLLGFSRRIQAYLPPKRGRASRRRAGGAARSRTRNGRAQLLPRFRVCRRQQPRRSLVVVLTDLVDEEGSRELLASLKLLRPRHLPLVVTIADRDLKAVVRETPQNESELFRQSVAEEIIHLREAALRWLKPKVGWLWT